ncbi:MFS transporter [Streptomyces sp. NPDC090306]|uniref:MFS transporter n=1 Tax=Streptomyces sp. NPDC090306 TaxID=3365961 RepID=UPI0038094A29
MSSNPPETNPPGPRGRRAEFWALVTTHGANDFYSGAVIAMEPYLISERHYDYAAVAGITLAATSLSSVAQPVFGFLSDRFSLRPFILVGLLAAAAGVALSGPAAGTYWLTWLLVAVSGIGVAAYHPPATIDAKDAGGGGNRSMSVFSVGGNIGVALAPLAVSATVGVFGLGATPLLAIPTVAAGAFYAVVGRRAVRTVPHQRHGAAAPGAAPAVRETDDWRRFAWLLVVISFWSITYVGTQSFVSLYSTQRFHAGAATASLALTVFPAAGAAGTLGGGWLADRFGRLRTIRAGYLLSAIAVTAIVAAPNTATVVLASAVLGCAIFLPFAPQLTLSHAYLPRHVGTASGVTLGLALSLGGFLTPALGHLADGSGIRTVFVLIAALTAAGFLCSVLLTERPATAARPDASRTPEGAATETAAGVGAAPADPVPAAPAGPGPGA